jgi:hypothetical protein
MATDMKKLLLIAAVCGISVTTTPVSAQVYFDADPGGSERTDSMTPTTAGLRVTGDAGMTPTPEVSVE